MSDLIDELDARILDLIQEDASLSVADLAERVGLSPSPCWRRIKRLEDLGVIRKRVTLLDADKLGLGFEVYVSVKLSLPSRTNLEAFEACLTNWPEVVACATVTGHEDYVLRVMTSDMHAYDDFLRDKLLASDLVSGVESRIVMRTVRSTTAVPIRLTMHGESKETPKLIARDGGRQGA
ncbi:Lrp/AsnC family transcriptional regulator [Asticcacaulis sp. AC402]|uniref:Lrp/AsnC family transcriptional regulator n=1 Tax=Asticcacaulis sp. AC402 TaxID=1282361 RepID=UPI0003C406B2|nr:Lrp/AsnC family transcriptional regulator [Asticcacaulis sp. AC402]ESQ75998.1 AsnC family transcriptional regulator [Asticcacaulis sp. AC402]